MHDLASGRRTWIGALIGAVSGIVMLGPALGRGYVWFYDMVFVPDLPMSPRTLGTDGSVPRAVPTDAVVSLLGSVLPGDVVQWVVLLVPFVVVGAGCARWCRSAPGAAAAALASCWNPYVAERLVIGHWSFLLGYATLPWVLRAARDVARGEHHRWAALGGWLALAALAGSTSAVIAGIAAVIALLVAAQDDLRARSQRVGVVVAGMVVLNAAWLVPSLGRPGGVPADPGGVAAFAARADSPWGTLVSVVTLGGIWHEPSWPASRGSVVSVGFALAVVIGLLVLVTTHRLWRELRPVAVAALAGLLVAAAAALPGGDDVVTWLVTDVPGAGIIRDSQKFVALLAVFLAVAAGRVVDELIARRGTVDPSRGAVMLAVGLLLAPVVALPDAASSVGGRMAGRDIPASFTRARDHLDAAAAGDVAVFPWALYRRFAWNGDRVSLDPWNRLVDRRVVVNDDLPLSSTTVAGEDEDAAAIGAEIDRGGADVVDVLRDRGVRWVVVLADQPGAAREAAMLREGGAVTDRRFGDITVLDLGDGVAAGEEPGAPWALLATGVSAAALILVWIAGAARRPRVRRP